MGRTNYKPPRYIERAVDVAENEHDSEIVHAELAKMIKRHDNLLQEMYRLVDNYGRLLQEHGPHHEVELGEPLSRFENILRKAMNQ